MMDDDSSDLDYVSIIDNRIQRLTRSSTLKSKKSNFENEKEKIDSLSTVTTNDDHQIDPPEPFQLGDIVWLRLSGYPWWPALIYGSFKENNMYTKVTSNKSSRPKKRSYFAYFFGPYFEYTWMSAHSLLPYFGLDKFLRHAEDTTHNASTKREQVICVNRFELKVTDHNRPNWHIAIEEADLALKLSREERVQNFEELLKIILMESNGKKIMAEKRRTSTGSRQSKRSLSPHVDKSSTNSPKKCLSPLMKRRKAQQSLPPPVNEVPSKPLTESATTSAVVSQFTSSTLLHAGLPTLTKYEEKRIVNGLLDYSKGDQLTFDKAQSFACELVIEIIKENFNYEMSCIQIEWFYDLLIKHPQIIFKHQHWLDDDNHSKPMAGDVIDLKRWELKNFLSTTRER